LPESQNAWLWSRLGGDVNCARFDLFGSDRNGSDDAQIGYHSAIHTTGTSCTTYWTGLAGRDAWRWNGTAPETTLPNDPGLDSGGFLFVAQGGPCGSGSSYVASVRFIPSASGAAAWGNRVDALSCEPGVLSTIFVSGPSSPSLGVARCDSGGNCDASPSLDLPGGSSQMVLVNFDINGVARWHGAFAPLDADGFIIEGTATAGVVRDNLSADLGDRAHIVFTTTGPLETQNVNVDNCNVLSQGAVAGTFVVSFSREGAGDRAECAWAIRLGP